jgi:hypothetical protein
VNDGEERRSSVRRRKPLIVASRLVEDPFELNKSEFSINDNDATYLTNNATIEEIDGPSGDQNAKVGQSIIIEQDESSSCRSDGRQSSQVYIGPILLNDLL